MKNSSIMKNSIVIMVLTIISKLTGFIRDILVAAAYGTTYETDAYNISLTIPTIAFALIGTAVSTIFIPIFSKLLKEKGKEEMYDFANRILVILFSIILFIYLLALFKAKNIVGILAPKIDENTIFLAIKLTKISMINLAFLSLYSVFSAILQTLREFVSVTLVGIVINIPIIIYILCGNDFGITGLTIVTVIGYILQVLIQLPSLIKNKYRFKFSLDFSDKIFKKIPILLMPVVLGVGINEINTFVDQVVASGLAEGTISAVSLSGKVNTIVYGIYASAIVTAIYPVLASEADNIKVFKNLISKGVCNITLIMLPSAVGMMTLSTELIKVMFERGIFDENSVKMTSASLFFLSIGITFYGIRDVISKAFYSLQDTITPMKNGAIGVVVNIVLDISLAKSMGIGGLSLATSISAIVTTVVLYVDLKKKLNGLLDKKFVIDLIKIMLSSCIMGVFIYLLKNFIIELTGTYLLVKLLIIVCISCLIYALMLKLLKTDIFEENLNIIICKLKNVIQFKTKEKNKVLKDEEINMRN